MKTFLSILTGAAIGLAAFAGPADARTGRISMTVAKAGLIVGVSGGSGVLTLGGKSYRVSIGGVSLGATIGASEARLAGTVQNINNPRDIEGAYAAVTTGAAVATGGKAVRLRNEKGVVLDVQGAQSGLEFSVDLSGMTIALQ
jgi:hypothetical protein